MANIILYEQYIRKQSIINNNVDFDLLRPIIFMIQDLKLQPILGTDLYNLILTQTTPPTSLTVANQTLVNDYVLPFLHWHLVAECLVTMHLRIMNKGIMEKNGENSSQASTDDVKFMETRYTSIANNYGNKMRLYIIANQNLFPAYSTNGTLDKTQPSNKTFTSPFYIPGYRRKLRNDEGPLDC